MSGRFPEPGKLFEEKYRVEKLLGSGGFARVYLAEQTDLGRKVAIKVLSPKVSQAVTAEETDPKIESVALRFEREARVVSQLKSPQTITMYDYGRTESGLLYMVMEYVDGTELDQIAVPIEPRRVVKILKQMLQSLHEAHAVGLLHRDLKPANIMVYEHLGEKDQVKLLDFGIAKAVGEAASDTDKDLTAADSLIGTPRYMSPEQIRGEDIGPASDVYSLGLVAYELLVGEKAITNSDSIEILGRHLSSESFEIPRHHAIHPKLRRLINKMLAKDLDERYASTKQVLEDLAEIERFDGDLRVGGGPPPTPGDEDESNVYEFLDDLEEASDSRGGAKTGLIAAVIAVLLVGGGFAAWKMVGTSETEQVEIGAAEPEEAAAPLEVEGAKAEEDSVEDEDEDDEDAARIVTLIRTRPSGASVWLGESLAGMAPVQFDSPDYEFPLTVRAKLGERSVEKTLDAPGGEIWLELPEPKVAENEVDEDKDERSPKPKTAAKRQPRKAKVKMKEKDSPPKPQPKVEPKVADDKESDEDVDTRKYLPLE